MLAALGGEGEAVKDCGTQIFWLFALALQYVVQHIRGPWVVRLGVGAGEVGVCESE
jgi:hypothetical protein